MDRCNQATSHTMAISAYDNHSVMYRKGLRPPRKREIVLVTCTWCLCICAEVQFPLELRSAEKDHPFLDSDALEALYRRLEVLNRCAKMKIDYSAKPQVRTVLAVSDCIGMGLKSEREG